MANITLKRYDGGWDTLNPETTWNQITSKPSTFTPTSHTHGISDITNLQTSLDALEDNTHTKHDASDLAVGWYTIATNTGNRAIARFGLRDTDSSRHQSVIFYAAHHYGNDDSNTITVLHNSRFGTSPFRYIRIKEGGTYDGAALQIYIDNAQNNVRALLLGDNFQSSGWVLKDWVADAIDPGDVDNWSSMTEKGKIDLDQIDQGGIATTGNIYAAGNITQGRVLTTNDEGSGNGIDADTVDGLQASSFIRSDSTDSASGNLTFGGTTTFNNQVTIDTGTSSNALYLKGTSPTITFADDDGSDDFFLHANSNNFYILTDRNGGDQVGAGYETPHPLQLEADTNTGYLFGNRILTTADEGSGNGIDADTLDGITSGSFLRSNADDIYTGTLTLGTNTTIKLPNSASYGIRTSTGHRVIDSVDATLRIGDTGKHSLITLHGQDGDDFKVYYGNTHYQIWHEGNDGNGSGLSADNLRGYVPVEGASANSIAKRNGDGDLTVTDLHASAITVTDTGIVSNLNADRLDNLHASSFLQKSGGTMSGNINMSNQNITGVNQLEINDPGEGIVFKQGSSGDITLAIIDDSFDSILNLSGTNAALQVNGTSVSLNGHTHGSYDNAGTLTGANVYSQVAVTDGIVTGLTSRTLTAGDVGAATQSHSHPTNAITSGEFNTARLGSGTATSGYVLQSDGDGTASWAAASGGGNTWTEIKTGQTTVTGGTGATNISLSQSIDDTSVIAFELNSGSAQSYTSQIFIVKIEDSNSNYAGILFNSYANNSSIRTGSIRVFRTLSMGPTSTSVSFSYSYYHTNGSSSESVDTVYIGKIWKLGVTGA